MMSKRPSSSIVAASRGDQHPALAPGEADTIKPSRAACSGVGVRGQIGERHARLRQTIEKPARRTAIWRRLRARAAAGPVAIAPRSFAARRTPDRCRRRSTGDACSRCSTIGSSRCFGLPRAIGENARHLFGRRRDQRQLGDQLRRLGEQQTPDFGDASGRSFGGFEPPFPHRFQRQRRNRSSKRSRHSARAREAAASFPRSTSSSIVKGMAGLNQRRQRSERHRSDQGVEQQASDRAARGSGARAAASRRNRRRCG